MPTLPLTDVLEHHESKPWIAWRCPCCGQRSTWLSVERERSLVTLGKTWDAHRCPVQGPSLPPVVLDESDPFARC